MASVASRLASLHEWFHLLGSLFQGVGESVLGNRRKVSRRGDGRVCFAFISYSRGLRVVCRTVDENLGEFAVRCFSIKPAPQGPYVGESAISQPVVVGQCQGDAQ